MKSTVFFLVTLLSLISDIYGQEFQLQTDIDACNEEGKTYIEKLNNGAIFRRCTGLCRKTNGFISHLEEGFTLTYIMSLDGSVSKLEQYVGEGGFIENNIFYCIYIYEKKLKFIAFDLNKNYMIQELSSSIKLDELMRANKLKNASSMTYEILKTFEASGDRIYFQMRIEYGSEYFLVNCYSEKSNINNITLILPENFPEINNANSIEERAMQSELSSKRIWYNMGVVNGNSFYRKRVSFPNKKTKKIDSCFYAIAKFNSDGKLIKTYTISASPLKAGTEILRRDITTISSTLWANLDKGCIYTETIIVDTDKSYITIIRKYDLENGNLIWSLEKPAGERGKFTLYMVEKSDNHNDNKLIFMEEKKNGEYCLILNESDLQEISYEKLDEATIRENYTYSNKFNSSLTKFKLSNQSLKKQGKAVYFDRVLEFNNGAVFYVCPTNDKRLNIYKCSEQLHK